MRRAMLILSLLLLLASAAVPAAPGQSLPKKARQALDGLSGERMRAHLKFLASDLLEGRGTGQRGGEIAAAYIATEFALYGLKPAGDDGAFFQNVPMVGVKTLPDTTMKFVGADGKALDLRNLDDFVTNNESQTETAEIDAPIVFVGYGI